MYGRYIIEIGENEKGLQDRSKNVTYMMRIKMRIC
jgi:hypothetical protein